MSSPVESEAIARDAAASLYLAAQSSMKVATLDECSNPNLPAIKLEYFPSAPDETKKCILTIEAAVHSDDPAIDQPVRVEDVASAIRAGRPLLPRLLALFQLDKAAKEAMERGFIEVCTLESAVVNGYRIYLRHDLAPLAIPALETIDVGPAGYALRVTPPRTAKDRNPRWFPIMPSAIADAVECGKPLLEYALRDNHDALRFLATAIPEVEKIVIGAGIGKAASRKSPSI